MQPRCKRMKRDIYNIDPRRALQSQNKHLDKEASEHNAALVKRFQSHLLATGTKELRVTKLTWGLRKICRVMAKDLDKVTKPDFERVAAEINQEPTHTENTKSDYKRALKHFYRWFEDEDERLDSHDHDERKEAKKAYSYLKKYVKTTVKPKPIDPGSIITEDDLRKVLEKGCRNDMERALVMLHHEMGSRIGETLGIRLKDIQRGPSAWTIRVEGKTGERARPILDSIPFLVRWLDYHPSKDDPDEYLFVSIEPRWYGKPINYRGAVKLIERVFEQAGVKKRHNTHFFRHSRATLDAPKFMDSIQAQMMGWTQGSKQLARYRHMSPRASLEAFLRTKGLSQAQEEEEAQRPIKCVCGRLNEPQASYCSSCGKAVTVEVATKEREYLEEAFKVMERIASDPELMQRFKAFKEQKQAEA